MTYDAQVDMRTLRDGLSYLNSAVLADLCMGLIVTQRTLMDSPTYPVSAKDDGNTRTVVDKPPVAFSNSGCITFSLGGVEWLQRILHPCTCEISNTSFFILGTWKDGTGDLKLCTRCNGVRVF